ncbi:response regulator transcription factor [Pseudonocardia benzenivorans]
MRRAGVAVPRRGRGDAEVPQPLRALGVTSRETDVLLLVAEGCGNREIAERLFLSPRTVEKHVERLLAKTGSQRRAELVAAATRLLGP